MATDDDDVSTPSRGRAFSSSFLRDALFHKRLINIGHLLSGNGISGLLAMAGVALTARSLGPTDYGILALTISYVRVFDRLMRFESWQPLIKYAANVGSVPAESREKLRSLFAFGLWLDCAACLAAAIAASALAILFSPLFGLERVHIWLVIINCATLAFNISGTPTAVLRLAGRFRTIAYVQVIGSAVRILLCGAGLWMQGGLLFFITAWTVSQIVSSVLFLALSMSELRRQGIQGLHHVPLRGITRQFPGIMGFAWSSSISLSIRSSAMELDVLIVGALADARSAGLYFLAKQVARMVQQVCGQVQAVLYPDVARLWAERAFGQFRHAIVQVQLMLDLFAVATIAALAIGGSHLIILGMGQAFAPAYPLLMVQMIALALTMHAAPMRSALLAMGEQRAVLHIVLWGTVLFQGVAFLLIPRIGAMGANVAHVVLAGLCAVAMERVFHRRFAFVRTEGHMPAVPR